MMMLVCCVDSVVPSHSVQAGGDGTLMSVYGGVVDSVVPSHSVQAGGDGTLMSRAHSFPQQILPNSTAPFAKFRGSPWQILGISRLTAAAHFTVHYADFGPVIYTYNFK